MLRKTIITISLLLNVLLISVGAYLFHEYSYKVFYWLNKHKKYDVVLFGDSLISGYKWQQDFKGIKVCASGYGGITTSQLSWLVTTDVTPHEPEICFVEGGNNDITVGIPIDRTIANYSQILDTLQHYEIKPVIQGMLYTNEHKVFHTNPEASNRIVDTINSRLRILAEQRKVDFIDLNQKLTANRRLFEEYTTDGVHLSPAGYKVWTGMLNEYLKKNDFE